jgi:hypothetical protein
MGGEERAMKQSRAKEGWPMRGAYMSMGGMANWGRMQYVPIANRGYCIFFFQ